MTTRLLPLLVILCAFAIPAAAAVGDHPPPQYCPNGPGTKPCYQIDPLGGWGLTPKRTYSLAYDGDKVCKPIVSALNKAIKGDHKKELASVIFPMPAHPELHLRPEQIGPVDLRGQYQAQNALFSDPIFLRWQPLGGISTDGNTGFQAKEWTDRWIIVDLENDGHRYLVSTGGDVMDVPEDQMDKHDWTLPDEWKPYRMLEQPWPGAPDGAMKTNPLLRWKYLEWGIPGTLIHQMDAPKRFSHLTELSNGYYPKPWRSFSRPNALTEFASIDGRIYTILVDSTYDMMVVDDFSRKLGDDLCYIQSDIKRDRIYP